MAHADVSDRAAVERMYAAVLRTYGRLDLVVSNAYYSKRQPVLEQDWAEMRKTFEVTLQGVGVKVILMPPCIYLHGESLMKYTGCRGVRMTSTSTPR